MSETIVREFFELHGFLVHQRRKYVAPASEDDDEADFYVLNPTPPAAGAGPLPFLMVATDLPRLQRAIVVVKGWHTETFSPARLESAPAILRFVEPAIFAQARRFFGDPDTLTKVLIVPTLPQAEDARERTVALLREKGVDAVIPFRIILTELVRRTEPNRNYRKSDLLQVIRILKHYDLLREPQLELFRAGRRR